jgi:hypothetical protein
MNIILFVIALLPIYVSIFLHQHPQQDISNKITTFFVLLFTFSFPALFMLLLLFLILDINRSDNKRKFMFFTNDPRINFVPKSFRRKR